jgi:secreted trypsin-like serine protease
MINNLLYYLDIPYHFSTVEALIGNIRSAAENEFPFIVAISKSYRQDTLNLNYFCAGTLISRKDVLTSEHCLRDQNLNRITVLVGSSYLDRGLRYYPSWWITFDQWAVQNNHEIVHEVNDIALLNVIMTKDFW